MSRKRVAVIFGGRSSEHEVSIVSARSVMAAFDATAYEVVPFGIGKSGGWLGPEATAAALGAGAVAFDGGTRLLESGTLLAALARCDIAFPLIHGTYGEDGTLQGFLEMAGLPYTGCGVAASAIGMDKALMKALFRDAGIPVAPYGVVRRCDLEQEPEDAFRSVAAATDYPCFVKPANGGSSVGVTKVRSSEDLAAALQVAFATDDKAIVERAVTGQEVECSVLGNERPEVSICGEVVPDREFYDYDSKYSPESTTALHIPARISPATAEAVREMALRMYTAMGCEGYARVDFFVAGERVIANEVNTIPGFTSISMYPKLWAASGLPYTELLTRIIEFGFARHAGRAQK